MNTTKITQYLGIALLILAGICATYFLIQDGQFSHYVVYASLVGVLGLGLLRLSDMLRNGRT